MLRLAVEPELLGMTEGIYTPAFGKTIRVHYERKSDIAVGSDCHWSLYV